MTLIPNTPGATWESRKSSLLIWNAKNYARMTKNANSGLLKKMKWNVGWKHQMKCKSLIGITFQGLMNVQVLDLHIQGVSQYLMKFFFRTILLTQSDFLSRRNISKDYQKSDSQRLQSWMSIASRMCRVYLLERVSTNLETPCSTYRVSQS